MKYTVTGLMGTYGQASAAVRDLELVGITGEQVELISDADEDARTVESEDKAPVEGEVRDTPGETPEYIDEQEFYASHVREGRAVVIVRTETELGAKQAEAILKEHGAEIAERRKGDERPESVAPSSVGHSAPGIGDNAATKGGDATDLEAKGKQFRVRGNTR